MIVQAEPIKNMISMGGPANFRSFSFTSNNRKNIPSGAAYWNIWLYKGGALPDEGTTCRLARIAVMIITVNTDPRCLKNGLVASHSDRTTTNSRMAMI